MVVTARCSGRGASNRTNGWAEASVRKEAAACPGSWTAATVGVAVGVVLHAAALSVASAEVIGGGGVDWGLAACTSDSG